LTAQSEKTDREVIKVLPSKKNRTRNTRVGGLMSEETVLVTGGSGFVGVHCVLRLLEAGYTVRTTVRGPDRAETVRAMLRTAGAEPGDALRFAIADLTSDDGWAAAVKG